MAATLTNEEILVIETPERVPLHFALASIGNRFLAVAIDHAIQLLIIGLIVLTSAILASFSFVEHAMSSAPGWVKALTTILLFLVISGYFAFFEWIWSGQTPGKRWLKLRVIREDGRPITFWEASVRNLLRTMDMFFPPFYSVGLIAVFLSTRDQRIGDMVGGHGVCPVRVASAGGIVGEVARRVR